MGVIRRQSIKHSAVNLVGLSVGALSTFLVYPHVRQEYGVIQVLLQAGLLGLPLLSLGANTVAIRFFPKFRDESVADNGFLPLLMLLCGLGFTLSLGLAAIFWAPYTDSISGRSPLIAAYLPAAIPIAFFFTISTVLYTYSANFKRIVIPSLLLDFSQKLVLPALMIAVWKDWLSLYHAIWGMILHSGLVTIAMIVYLKKLGVWHWKPNWKFLTPNLRKEMGAYIAFWSLGGFALLVASKSDIFAVGSLSAESAAGTFAIATALAAIIEIPIKSLYSASASSVAEYLAKNDLEELGKLYKSVSINLLVAGALLFGGMWVAIRPIFGLFPADHSGEMEAGIWVFFFVGLTRLVEMTTGLNNYLVYYSPHYRYALISLSACAALTVGLNLWLIPTIGFYGAAISTLVSVTLYNSFSVWLIWRIYRLFPFTRNTLVSILLALTALFVAMLIPETGLPVADMIIKGGSYALLFAFLILRLNISPDISALWKLTLLKLLPGRKTPVE